MELVELINAQAAAIMTSPIVTRAWVVLSVIVESLAGNSLPILVDRNPMLWVPRGDFNLYNISGKIEDNPLMNEQKEVASRSCLLSFLSAIKMRKAGAPAIYLSIGSYYRHEEVVVPGVREPVFPQLEVEVVSSDADQALRLTLDLLQAILVGFSFGEYVVKIQGTLPQEVLNRPEVVYAGIDRQWKLYKTKKNIGFEVFPADSDDALAGGGDFSDLAKKFGLNPRLNAVGFGLGLFRIR